MKAPKSKSKLADVTKRLEEKSHQVDEEISQIKAAIRERSDRFSRHCKDLAKQVADVSNGDRLASCIDLKTFKKWVDDAEDEEPTEEPTSSGNGTHPPAHA